MLLEHENHYRLRIITNKLRDELSPVEVMATQIEIEN